ncbi:uncharacterized protein LOC116303836 [Actinia tenebrosa]|uniref:Uncharacterized protein LOC116303836 n=1 Tax=Actinia tenebrosa TaxID=6105 RepID=A0A6P8IQS9_ACTTE|nr:uncharacterized protein LOC116303836 [Actinia tenebrosa]
MANIKYSYVFWGLFGVFILALWIALYVGCVIPIEKSETFRATQCKTIYSRDVGHQKCPCTSSSDDGCGKSYSCLQIFVSFTVQYHNTSTPQARRGLLHFAENILHSNCSYEPFCESSQDLIDIELLSYFYKRGKNGTVFSCYYNEENETQIIEVNYNGRRLAILLPFAAVFIVSILVVSVLLWRRGCGCNRKRRPSRLSFVTATDEF